MYVWQHGDIAVPSGSGPLDAAKLEEAATEFERRYAKLYGQGSGFREAGIFAITFRVRGVGVLNAEPHFEMLEKATSPSPTSALLTRRPVCLDGRKGFVETPVYDYQLLKSGHVIQGPAIIQVPTTSVVVPDGMRGEIDGFGNLRILTTTNVVQLPAQRSAA